MTNEQAVLEAEQKASELKKQYLDYLTPIAIRIQRDQSSPTLEELLKCQQLGAAYFNFVEAFVGTSGLLGAHVNGKWVTGFAETCHSVLAVAITHHTFLESHSDVANGALSKLDVNAYANMQRMTKEYLQKDTWPKLEQEYRAHALPITGFKVKEVADLKEIPKWQLITGLAIGVVFAIAVLLLAVLIPGPSLFQIFIFRGVFAISLAAVAAIIPGFLNVESRFNKFSVKATGAIAVFIIVWLINPPALINS